MRPNRVLNRGGTFGGSSIVIPYKLIQLTQLHTKYLVRVCLYVSCSLNTFKGLYWGLYRAASLGLIQGATRS